MMMMWSKLFDLYIDIHTRVYIIYIKISYI
jgi:hypothetical protein